MEGLPTALTPAEGRLYTLALFEEGPPLLLQPSLLLLAISPNETLALTAAAAAALGAVVALVARARRKRS